MVLVHAILVRVESGEHKINMEKYYFKTKGSCPDIYCIEPCHIKGNGVMIGSVTCQECEYHKSNDQNKHGDISWIKCSKIKEATIGTNK